MYKVKKVVASNFFSYDELSLSFKKEGGVLIRSQQSKHESADPEHSNGMGKSTVLEAVTFALYNKTLRGTTNYLKRGAQWCMAGVDLVDRDTQSKVQIRRYRKHPEEGTKLKIFKDGTELTQDLTDRASQEIIDNLFGDFDSFAFRTISPELANFMALSPNSKTEYLLEYFGVDFSSMYNRAAEGGKRAEIKKHKEQSHYHELSGEFREIGAKIASHEEYLANLEETKVTLKAADEKARREIADLKKEYLALGVETLQEETDKLKAAINKAEACHEKMVRKTAQAKRDLESYNEALSEKTCPTCLQNINKALLQARKEELTKAVAVATAQEKEGLKEKKELSEKLAGLRETQDKAEAVKTKGKHLNDRIRQNKETMKKLDTYSSDIDQYVKRHSELKDILEHQEAAISLCELECTVWLEWKKQLGAKGVKHIFLADFLNILNERINYFLKMLFPEDTVVLKFGIMDDKISYDLMGRDYSNASNGERKRINIAVAMGMADLKKSGAPSLGFRFLDEVMDSLDPAGISAVLDILVETSGVQTFVVSHNPVFEEELLQKIPNLCIVGVHKDEEGISKAEMH